MAGVFAAFGLTWENSIARAASVELLPGPSLFRPLLADPREAQHVIRYLAANDHGWGEVAFGDTFGFVRIGEVPSLQVGLQASVYTRFTRDENSLGFLDLNNTDYSIALPFDVHTDRFDLRVAVGHLSSHLGENEVQRQISEGERQFFDPRFVYRRDSVKGVLSSDLSAPFRVYAGGSYAFHVTPENDRGTLQLGGEWRSEIRPFGLVDRQWYLAADFQSWAESDWTINANVQAGVRLGKGKAPQAVRVAVEGYNGRVLQRILADQHERYLSIGLYFEL